MSAPRKDARPEPVVLGIEFKLSVLPTELQSAIKFADAHDRRILIGYVADEGKAYLMTVRDEDL